MRASYNWLCELTGATVTPEQMADKLTHAGLEVEALETFGELGDVVVAEVKAVEAHPKRPKLQVVRVSDGSSEHQVVCGASNVPAPGGKVTLARLGAQLPGGLCIAPRELAGVKSHGMLCAEAELGIGSDHEGIMVLDADEAPGATVGQPLVDALTLKDTVFEIGLTPNRPDCLGHLGLARDLAVLLDVPLRLPALPKLGPASDNASLSLPRCVIENADVCARYAAAMIRGVKVRSSPFALRYLLYKLGLNSINNVVDLTNWVMMLWGHPVHAFDRQALQGDTLQVRYVKAGESVVTLDGERRQLEVSDPVICDASGPVALAGIMGGRDSGVNESSTDIVLECAYFTPTLVRRSARRLQLHSDASHRFERGVDPLGIAELLRHASAHLAAATGGWVSESQDCYPKAIEATRIALRPARAEALLGIDIPTAAMQRTLEGLGCEVTTGNAQWQVKVPGWRPDLKREEDLIEELARIKGYDAIPSVLPARAMQPAAQSALHHLGYQLLSNAVGLGFHEVLNYAFIGAQDLERCAIQEPTPIALSNPLSQERSVMRTSLLPGLLQNAAHAHRYDVDGARLVELGRVYWPSSGDEHAADETWQLGLLLSGTQQNWFNDPHAADFYAVKGALEALLHRLGIGTELEWMQAHAVAESNFRYGWQHPKRSAFLYCRDQVLARLGELHPRVREAFGLTMPVAYAELDLATVHTLGLDDAVTMVPPPRVPAVTRDLALLVAEDIEAQRLMTVLQQAGGELVESLRLFDVYEGEKVAAGMKSLAFRIHYRDPQGTLTDKQVDALYRRMVKQAEVELQVTVR